MTIALVTDSTSDIPADLIKKYKIGMIPAIIVLGEQQYEDGKGLTRQEFYSRLDEFSPPPTTAAPALVVYQDLYKKLLAEGAEHVISIHVASQLSGISATARLAAAGFDERVTVIDSGQLTLGIGFQVLAAAEAIAEGADLQETLAVIEETAGRVRVIAMLDTLDQLRRSGRVSWLRAGLGALLRIKLFVQVKEGQVLRLSETRTRKKGLALLADMLDGLGPLERLALLHTNAEEDAKAIMQAYAPELPQPPLLMNVTTVIGTHVGTNAVGIAAVLKE